VVPDEASLPVLEWLSELSPLAGGAVDSEASECGLELSDVPVEEGSDGVVEVPVAPPEVRPAASAATVADSDSAFACCVAVPVVAAVAPVVGALPEENPAAGRAGSRTST
jgi:hypothetical protein